MPALSVVGAERGDSKALGLVRNGTTVSGSNACRPANLQPRRRQFHARNGPSFLFRHLGRPVRHWDTLTDSTVDRKVEAALNQRDHRLHRTNVSAWMVDEIGRRLLIALTIASSTRSSSVPISCARKRSTM